MQQHMTPRKGYNFISLDIIQYTNAKEKEKTSEEDDWLTYVEWFKQEGGSVSIVFPYSPTTNSSLPVWRHIATGQSLKQKFGFIKRVDKGWITTVKDLESWRFER